MLIMRYKSVQSRSAENSSKPVEIYSAEMRRKFALITFNFAVERIVVGSSFQTSRAGTEKVVSRYWMNACTKDM